MGRYGMRPYRGAESGDVELASVRLDLHQVASPKQHGRIRWPISNIAILR